MARSLIAACIACAAMVVAALAPAEATEKSNVRLAVGGRTALFYLPLSVTERLGYFKAEGLDVEISDFQGGARALQALVGGSADVVTGAYDHTIQIQARGQPIVAVAQLGRYPGYVVGVLSDKAQTYRGPADLKGMNIGVTAPGSSTQFLAQYLMTRAGLKTDDASFIGIGTGASAVASVSRGEVDALVNVDPTMSLLESQGAIKVVADTRTKQGTRAAFGGPYPAAVLYTTPAFVQRHPRTVQALVNAVVRGLKWMQVSSAEQIAAIMPEEYALGDRALYLRAIRNSLPMYSPDGRFSREGAETALAVLRQFEPEVARARIDLSTTYTNAFVERGR